MSQIFRIHGLRLHLKISDAANVQNKFVSFQRCLNCETLQSTIHEKGRTSRGFYRYSTLPIVNSTPRTKKPKKKKNFKKRIIEQELVKVLDWRLQRLKPSCNTDTSPVIQHYSNCDGSFNPGIFKPHRATLPNSFIQNSVPNRTTDTSKFFTQDGNKTVFTSTDWVNVLHSKMKKAKPSNQQWLNRVSTFKQQMNKVVQDSYHEEIMKPENESKSSSELCDTEVPGKNFEVEYKQCVNSGAISLEQLESELQGSETVTSSQDIIKETDVVDTRLDPIEIDLNKLVDIPHKDNTSIKKAKIVKANKSDVTKSKKQNAIEKEIKEIEQLRKSLEDKTLDMMKLDPDLLVKALGNKAAANIIIEKRHMDKITKEFNASLEAYVTACISCDMLEPAQHTPNCYSCKNIAPSLLQKGYVIKDAEIYNRLMHAMAKQGRLRDIIALFDNMETNRVAPTLQSYAATLECLNRQTLLAGKKNVPFDYDTAEMILHDIHKQKFKLKDILSSCAFQMDEKEQVIQAIKKCDKNFKANPVQIAKHYSCDLLSDLNDLSNEVPPDNPFANVLPVGDLTKQAIEQYQLETQDHISVQSIEKRDPENAEKEKEMGVKLKKLQHAWRNSLKAGFERKLKELENDRTRTIHLGLYPYLKLFPPETYVELMMQEIQRLGLASEMFSPSMFILATTLGHRLMQKYVIHTKHKAGSAKKIRKMYHEYISKYNASQLKEGNHREMWQTLCQKFTDGPTLDVKDPLWPEQVMRDVGHFMYNIILSETKIAAGNTPVSGIKSIPAFYNIYRNHSNKMKEEVKPHPALVRLYRDVGIRSLTFDIYEVPMLVPPIPWTSVRSGGFMLASTKLVRLPEAHPEQHEVMAACPPEQLYPVLDSLNTLSSCAWKINKEVLDIIIDVFNSKGDKNLDIPPPISECPSIPHLDRNMDRKERAQVYQDRLHLKQQKSEMYSLWCNELYRLSIANQFRDCIFWFPHNMDFRGRVYPCPPHFNHLGSDVVRGMLQFAQGKPLGDSGLNWLKIHLINLTGFKKRSSNADRLAFADDHMADILDSADNPMTGNKWWQSSDEPWQTLACCMEIANAVRSPSISKHICHFPVHQDGSCNGLQHYAALGRDQAGAASVNVAPGDVPADVYSDVVALVEEERAIDAENGNDIAKCLEGFIRRKVIKQTVMTTVYGVTKYGAKAQILRQLKDIPEFPQSEAWAASIYLADKTFTCLQGMFPATKEIQDWLTLTAELIAKTYSQPVDWVTPVGLPVIQPYYKVIKKAGGITLQKPNSQKQKNAFPPNFIHSLDSTHMMLTSIHCLRAGITFASVHDCFWTHPCDVEIMNRICREQFLALHNQPILEDLSKHFIERFKSFKHDSMFGERTSRYKAERLAREFLDNLTSNLPSRGDFDLSEVLDSTYFFS
ncbi:unnamed protein product [Owenia fusiformis]|uniref:DNA-directed RNA polymerase n=1 Tax=Owenia fusiformis TaxID=6347 RepID=A0A8J1UV13_OWEFU|nr:unnamed protein product [Owenia fusiformis]